MKKLEKLLARIAPLKARLKNHTLYGQLQSLGDLQFFMSQHVFAVWDFMSLLKALQQELSCVAVPWLPSSDPVSRRLINEIVLAEESDLLPDGNVLSHFEWYYQAMKVCGASTEALDRLLLDMQTTHCHTPAAVLKLIQTHADHGHLHASVSAFLNTTWHTIAGAKSHQIAAAFTLGREDIIPLMFHELVTRQHQHHPELETFVAYLERHIELDGESHGPLALRMLSHLCGTDTQKWREAEQAAVEALEARLLLWDGIAQRLAIHV
jgi:hypothetical protein